MTTPARLLLLEQTAQFNTFNHNDRQIWRPSLNTSLALIHTVDRQACKSVSEKSTFLPPTPSMAKFMDLPQEIRTQIYRLLIDWDRPFLFGTNETLTKLCKIESSILLVNKTISQEAGLTFYKDNPAEIWIAVDYDQRSVINSVLSAALETLIYENAAPRTWQCCVTVHVSYGRHESEIYHSSLILYEKQAKYLDLAGASPGKDVLAGWRQWFSGGVWCVRSFWAYGSRGDDEKKNPMRALRTKRDRSWTVGGAISGDSFVNYLDGLLPSPLKGMDSQKTD